MGYFVPLNMHGYAHIQLTRNFFFPFKNKIVTLWDILANFVHIMKFEYKSDQEAKDNKLSGLGFVILVS